MKNAGLGDSQTGLKTARRNFNNLRYADDSTLMAENEEELKNILKRAKKESEKASLQLKIQKTNITGSGHITAWQIDWGKMKTVTDFIFLDSKITGDSDCSHKGNRLAPWKKSYDKPKQHIKKQRHHFANKDLSVESKLWLSSSQGVGP